MPYEYHTYQDPQLKILFHRDVILKSDAEFLSHWHKSPELLLFTKGQAIVRSDETEIHVHAGEIAIVDSNCLHSIRTLTESCQYYCLIPDISDYEDLGKLPEKSTDPEIVTLYRKIAEEYQKKDPHYRDVIKGYVRCLLALLARRGNDSDQKKPPESHKFYLVKAAIQFIYEHFDENLSVEDICRHVGLSRYYLCHIFKEVTGQTVLQHLNYIRCNNAHSMLCSGNYNVAQSAYASGFSNISYFSKTYKSIIGNLPSADLQKPRYQE